MGVNIGRIKTATVQKSTQLLPVFYGFDQVWVDAS